MVIHRLREIRRSPSGPPWLAGPASRAGIAAILCGLLWTPEAHAQGDPCPSTEASVQALLDRARDRFEAMDEEGFRAAAGTLDTALACATEPLAPATAARIHRVHAFRSYLDADDGRTVASFRAAIAIEAHRDLPLKLAPEGHLLQTLYDRARADLRESPVPADLPAGATLYVDGHPSEVCSGGRPAVVQLARRRERICWSGYLHPGEDRPDWHRLYRQSGAGRVLWWSAAGAGVVTAGLWGATLLELSAFQGLEEGIRTGTLDADDTPGDITDRAGGEALATRTNRLGVAAQVGSGVTAGLVVCAVWSTRW